MRQLDGPISCFQYPVSLNLEVYQEAKDEDSRSKVYREGSADECQGQKVEVRISRENTFGEGTDFYKKPVIK